MEITLVDVILVIFLIAVIVWSGKSIKKTQQKHDKQVIEKHEAEAAEEQKIIDDWNRQHPDQQMKS